jgi:hypothetical protein
MSACVCVQSVQVRGMLFDKFGEHFVLGKADTVLLRRSYRLHVPEGVRVFVDAEKASGVTPAFVQAVSDHFQQPLLKQLLGFLGLEYTPYTHDAHAFSDDEDQESKTEQNAEGLEGKHANGGDDMPPDMPPVFKRTISYTEVGAVCVCCVCLYVCVRVLFLSTHTHAHCSLSHIHIHLHRHIHIHIHIHITLLITHILSLTHRCSVSPLSTMTHSHPTHPTPTGPRPFTGQ